MVINWFLFSDFVVGTSQRGRPIILLDGYRFSKDRNYGEKIRWRCNRKRIGCTAYVTTIHNSIVKKCPTHNHK